MNEFGVIDAPNTFFGFCPTFRQLLSSNSSVNTLPHSRQSAKIGFTGYKERVLIATGSSLIWRRIVLWSYTQFTPAQPPVKGQSTDNPNWYGRQTTPLENTIALREFLFEGTDGTDYTVHSIHEAKLNRNNFTVAYDRTRWLNPTHDTEDFGYQKEFKFWNPGGKIIYDDDESGSEKLPANGWSSSTRESRGNMYIFDIFNSGLGLTSDVSNIARFCPQGTAYWVEG